MIQSANILQMGQIELKRVHRRDGAGKSSGGSGRAEPENGRLEENGELNEKIRRLEELASLDPETRPDYQDEEEETGRLEPDEVRRGFLECFWKQVCWHPTKKRRKNIPRYDQKIWMQGISQREFWENSALGWEIEETEGERILENFGRLETCGSGHGR